MVLTTCSCHVCCPVLFCSCITHTQHRIIDLKMFFMCFHLTLTHTGPPSLPIYGCKKTHIAKNNIHRTVNMTNKCVLLLLSVCSLLAQIKWKLFLFCKCHNDYQLVRMTDIKACQMIMKSHDWYPHIRHKCLNLLNAGVQEYPGEETASLPKRTHIKTNLQSLLPSMLQNLLDDK